MKPKYSGKKSYKFWNKVNALNGGNYQELYALGCCLQNMEEFVLKALKDAEDDEMEHKSKNK
jgi:hypothetical protein